jgi:hypothetical protein
LVNQRIIGILDEVGCRLSASASIQQDGEKQDSPSLDDSGQANRNTIHEFSSRAVQESVSRRHEESKQRIGPKKVPETGACILGPAPQIEPRAY